MAVLFGTQENIDCLQDVAIQGQSGEPLCLAHKYSSHFFVAGLYVSDDGYVLKIKGKDAYYPMPSRNELAQLQDEGALPKTMPPYSIPTMEYVFGYSLWWLVPLVVAATVVQRAWKNRRRAREALLPTSEGPPTIKTKTDRFVHDEVSKLLEPGERVQHQAHALDRVPEGAIDAAKAQAFFVALTDRRLVFVHTRNGAFGPLLENTRVETIAREQILRVEDRDPPLVVHLRDGSTRVMFVARSERHASNQQAFVRNVPRLLGTSAQPTQSEAVA